MLTTTCMQKIPVKVTTEKTISYLPGRGSPFSGTSNSSISFSRLRNRSATNEKSHMLGRSQYEQKVTNAVRQTHRFNEPLLIPGEQRCKTPLLYSACSVYIQHFVYIYSLQMFYPRNVILCTVAKKQAFNGKLVQH